MRYPNRMAKPPDGQSSWYHHDDVWQLLDGTEFARVVAEVAGGRAAITMARVKQPFQHFYVIVFVVDEAGLRVELVGKSGSFFQVPWRDETPASKLIPDDHLVIFPQKSFGGPMRDAPPLGSLRVVDPHAIELLDAHGRVRVSMHRGAADGGKPVCGGALSLVFPEHEGTSVSQGASSPP